MVVKGFRITYANVVSTLALFIVVSGGTAVAAGVAPNSVKSSSVADNSLTSSDLKDGRGVTGADVRDDSLTGADIDEGSLKLAAPPAPAPAPAPAPSGPTTPTGPAGGSLAGQFPNPTLAPKSVGADQVAPDAVDSPRVKDGSLNGTDIATDSLGADDVAEENLATVTSAQLGGIGRSSARGSCDPGGAGFVSCTGVEIPLPRAGRALLIASVSGDKGGSGPVSNGECRVAAGGRAIRSSATPVFNGQTKSIVAVAPPVGPGKTRFEVLCNEANQVKFQDVTITAVALSAS